MNANTAARSTSTADRRPEIGARSELAFTVALLLVALIPRLFVAIAWAREPVWDGHYYHLGAERIAEGFGYSEDVILNGQTVTKPWVHYPVGYSGFLGIIYRVFGSGLLVAPATNALIGAALVFVTYRVAQHYLSPGRAKVAGALTALHPGLIAYSAVVMNEPLSALLLMAALGALLVWRTQTRAVVISGLALGLAALVRPSTLLVLPFLPLALSGRFAERFVKTLVGGAVTFVVILPWTLRNCQVMDGCALVSTNGGWNLAIGALTETGRFRTLRASDGCDVVTGQVQQDRCWADIGLATIARDPGRWLGLIPKKLGHTFDHESFAIEYLHEADPHAWPEQRRVAGRHLLTWAHRLVLLLAALAVLSWHRLERPLTRGARFQLGAFTLVVGVSAYALLSVQHPFYLLAIAAPLIALARLPGAPAQGPAGRLLLGALFATCLTHAIFFGDDRYHLVITPALCILAAGALRPSPERSSESVVNHGASPGARPETA